MKTQTVQKLDYAKIKTAKTKLASITDKASKGLTKFKTGNITDASPEDVAEALTEVVVPAIEETMEVISDIVEALPTPEGEGLGDLGNGIGDENGNGNGETNLETSVNENIEGQGGDPEEQEERIAKLETSQKTLLTENIAMKKASLAKRHAATFPSNMRRAAEDEFLEENEEEEDLELLEAKVSSQEKVVKSYHDANLINKSRTAQFGNMQTAKKNGTKMHTAKGSQEIPWQLRR